MKLLQILITAQRLVVSPDQSKGQIRRFHRFHLNLHPHPYIRYLHILISSHTIGHIPETVAPALKKEIVLSVEAEVTGHHRDAAEEKWTLRGGIEVPCVYRFYSPKKSKAEFRNNLSIARNYVETVPFHKISTPRN